MVTPAGAATTRRTLLKASLVGAGVIGLGGCAGATRPLKVPPRTEAADVELLNAALAIELRSAAAYTAAAPLLSGFGGRMASLFLAQELQHAKVLRGLVHQLHGQPHNARTYKFPPPRGQAELLALLHGLERRQISAYLHAVPRLSTPYLRQTLAAIMANDAQHVTVLRRQQGIETMTSPFLSAGE